jgi:hypothetical protein
MRGWKRLKNINAVSGKLGEAHIDPDLPVASVRYRVSSKRTANVASMRGCPALPLLMKPYLDPDSLTF